MTRAKPRPAVGQWWRLNDHEGTIVRILPGGGYGMGIAKFEGDVPDAHVSTMLNYPAWAYLPNGPTKPAAPCTCVDLGGGVMLSDGCALHEAATVRACYDAPERALDAPKGSP